MRTRERVVECPVYIFTASCRMHFCSFFSPPRSYRLTNGLGRGHRGGRRLKSRRKERRENGSRGCEIERRRAGGDEGDLRDKEAARDLVPKCQFLMPQPADYLSRRGRACISVKSRSLHAERGAPDEERTRNWTYLEQNNSANCPLVSPSRGKRVKQQTTFRQGY